MERIEEMIQNLELLRMHFGDITKTCMANGIIDSTIKAIEKLATYKNAEKQGLLLRLPISEDAPVYSIEYCCGKNKSNRSGMCFRGFCENCSDKAYYIRESVAKHCSICEINKSVFFTREEAEAKLKEMEEKDGR
jgi:hypothetical protein